jgi:hypothetical protein
MAASWLLVVDADTLSGIAAVEGTDTMLLRRLLLAGNQDVDDDDDDDDDNISTV